jgi:hypothetical protein
VLLGHVRHRGAATIHYMGHIDHINSVTVFSLQLAPSVFNSPPLAWEKDDPY